MMDKILEDKNLCKACGGRCCKKSGCDYSTSDFESIKREVILGALETGEVSVVATFDFKRRSNGRLVSIPFLYLRARNKERDVIDLLSIKTGCSMLTDEGCIYNFQNRPTGGVNLVPMANGKCYPDKSPLEIVETWRPYQKLLGQMVKRFSGYSVDQKIRLDFMQLLEEVDNGKLDEVDELEKEDMQGFLPLLVMAYPEVLDQYIQKSTKNNMKVVEYPKVKKK